tara:strand:- start:1749 stop:2954 length:1206 start_codon:yes stop_codon:yes gene_type:complete
MFKNKSELIKPCIIGLGYVGLPILVNLSKKYKTSGYDINKKRIIELKKGIDKFGEFKKNNFGNKADFQSNLNKVSSSNLFIVTVPTPIFKNKKPDLSHIKKVCIDISKIVKKGDIVIFESTVYPGVTENICIPIIEKNCALKNGKDFYVGYSPERVNPGDRKHQLNKINKILAYPYNYKKKYLLKLYSLIAKKIILTENIKEAETAKVIENIQRDVNIGLINEIFLACKNLNLNHDNILKLASTKWNFLKFEPGLVGGHCLPVDPYYFSYICKKKKFNTRIALAGRYINDQMAYFVRDIIKLKLKKLKLSKKSKILLCGLSYKKNVADLRNSLAYKIFKMMKNKYVKGYDPLIDKITAKKNGLITSKEKLKKFDFYVILTEHDIIRKILSKINSNKIILPL